MSSASRATKMTPHAMRLVCGLVSVLALAACDESKTPGFLKPKSDSAPAAAAAGGASLVERDVEAPEIFEVREPGLWDGRPSLGGVWAAHPDVSDPERVIIRNDANGKFVIGALFRKERETPGPKLQISSDAASELGMLAGQPTELYVVALRRETVADAPAPVTEAETSGFENPAEITAGSLDGGTDVAAVAAAALDDGDAVIEPAAAPAPAAEPAPAPAPAPASNLDKPYIQIGIFSVEENAQNTAQVMRGVGIVPTVLEQSSSGKTFWRVIVGPAQTRGERSALLETIRGKGFEDAYPVTN